LKTSGSPSSSSPPKTDGSDNGDPRAVEILLVEDNPGDARLLEEMLREGTLRFTLVHATQLATARDRLRVRHPAVILLDLSLPDSHGIGTVRAMLETAPGVPILVLSGLADEEVAVAAVDAGAQDYLVKGQVTPELLRRSIRYAIQRKRLEAERVELLAAEKALRRRAQVARRRAETATRARDEILAIVAHDLRNPLTAVTVGLSMLIPDDPMEPIDAVSVRSTLETVLRAAEGMDRLIGDLLDLTRIEAGRFPIEARPLAVAPLLEEVRELFTPAAMGKHQELVVRHDDPLPAIAGDRMRLVQVFANLVGNAVKFTPPRGRIVVEATVEGDAVRFAVCDTGPGLPAGVVPHVFDRFWQAEHTRHQGTGLGLAIARGIVEAHGGHIGVQSEEGIGSTFAFTVPAADGRASR
jgi:signal transduction histidine kinase